MWKRLEFGINVDILRLNKTQARFDLAQLAGAVEYTECPAAEGGYSCHNECSGYDTK